MQSRRKLDDIIRDFGFNFKGIDLYERAKDFQLFITKKHPGLYILDAPEGRRLSCDPSIVGPEFERLNTRLARKAWTVFQGLGLTKGSLLFEHILRAAPGYGLRKAAEDAQVTDYFVRPKYEKVSYRHHTENEVRLVFLGNLDAKREQSYTLIKPDTEATGRTSKSVIIDTIQKLEEMRARVEKIILYGFISEIGYETVESYARQKGIGVAAIAIEDLTALSSNGYDMPLYGLDEQLYRRGRKRSKLTSTVSETTLESIFPTYYPGMDQPGDWSERQSRLFNGLGYEEGKIHDHLTRALSSMSSLREISKGEEWYDPQSYERTYRILQRKMRRRLRGLRNSEPGTPSIPREA